jgi:hypothetical protein
MEAAIEDKWIEWCGKKNADRIAAGMDARRE